MYVHSLVRSHRLFAIVLFANLVESFAIEFTSNKRYDIRRMLRSQANNIPKIVFTLF